MKRIAFLFMMLTLVSGCASLRHPAPSKAALQIREGSVIVDNDAAFLSKLKLVQSASRSIDMMYYIYADDYSSSTLTKALIDAAQRGVRVRLLVDYATNYKRLDLFSMMERQGRLGSGSLDVRFYNRPTKNIVKDAVYLTMGCARSALAPPTYAQCSAGKFAAIDRLFAQETINGQSVTERNISNLNIGNSGLFLSGLYAKRPDMMAFAVQTGQSVDVEALRPSPALATALDKERLKQLGRLYWKAHVGGPFQRLAATAELFFLHQLFGEELYPIEDQFTALLPVQKDFTAEAIQDWNHLTDFTHHKLLLVDGVKLQMGGRNIEDSYHMHPNPLARKYLFMDTDLYADLAQGGEQVAAAFSALWDFSDMVATLADVRQHAPNELVANIEVFKDAQSHCSGLATPYACIIHDFDAHAKSLAERTQEALTETERNAHVYRSQYAAKSTSSQGQAIPLDREALLTYLENLPFDPTLPPAARHRNYGVPVGEEQRRGKAIHAHWLGALPEVCKQASAAQPKEVFLHNAYFFLPANMTYALSQMLNGDYDCSHVTVTVLTNSIETTDLNVVNLFNRHVLKAFAEFYQKHSDPARRARFNYVEYQPIPGQPNQSLHSKVMVFGDDILVGSANADVRSLVMDTNNAMRIQNAAGLRRLYGNWLEERLNDPKRVQRLNDYFLSTPREKMIQEDLAVFREIIKKYHGGKLLPPPQQKLLESRFVGMLNEIYQLTQGSISPDAATRRASQNLFNEKYKPI
jgi:phosphatidylserine/phosphatidylglycerophosphate/cardiolipin synthase-like enzyme